MQGSQAYAKALAKAGILTDDEAKQITDGLSKVTRPALPCLTDIALKPGGWSGQWLLQLVH